MGKEHLIKFYSDWSRVCHPQHEWHFGLQNSFLQGAALCITGCLAAPSPPPSGCQKHTPGCDNQKCLETNVPPVQKHSSKEHEIAGQRKAGRKHHELLMESGLHSSSHSSTWLCVDNRKEIINAYAALIIYEVHSCSCDPYTNLVGK